MARSIRSDGDDLERAKQALDAKAKQEVSAATDSYLGHRYSVTLSAMHERGLAGTVWREGDLGVRFAP